MQRLPLLLLLATCGQAAEIVLPSPALERDAPVSVIFRTTPQATGTGWLTIRWTDVHKRVVEDRGIPVTLNDETDITFVLDLRRAAAMQNRLDIALTLDGIDKAGKPDTRRESASTTFIAKPADRKWRDYTIVMWQQHDESMFAALKPMGINAGQYSGRATTPPAFLLNNDLRWYAENIATDFYAEYHRWRRDRKPNWSFTETKELYKKDPSSREAFKRTPSFSDPVWLQRIQARLIDSARFHSQYRPLFYSLGDESGIADLAAFWDFDFSDHSLAEMRLWLKQRYTTLDALNRQWGTSFTSWDRVIPDTTNEAMQRSGDNFSSWSDHKEWMDISFARALKMGADAINSVDPDAYVGIGGAQMPGWGGYDYYRLTSALSYLEPYDIGNNVEIIRSLNPKVATVTAAFAKGPWEKHRVWYELLHGHRGLILWDDKSEYISKADLSVGERGREAAPYYNELRSGIGALLMNSTRIADPIAIHYSQASMRTEWMLARRPHGIAWVDRTSADERKDSEFLKLRESWCRVIEDLGLQYNFVAYGQIEAGELLRGGYRVLILPRSTALSSAEAEAIRAFVAQGGTVIADGEPGVFDEHSRRLSKPLLSGMQMVRLEALNYHQQRLLGMESRTHTAVQAALRGAGIAAEFTITGVDGRPPVGIELHRFQNGATTILGLHSNPQLRVDELGPPEFKSNQRFEKPQTVTIALPSEMHVVDLRRSRRLGKQSRLTLTIDPYEPTLLALSPIEMPELQVTAPPQIPLGSSATISIRFASATRASQHVFRVECQGPDGKIIPHYSENAFGTNGAAHVVPVALNDPPGRWTVRVTDILSGQTRTAGFDVL